MKTMKILCLGFIFVAIFALVGQAQIWNGDFWGETPPRNTLFVQEGESIQGAVGRAQTGDVIKIWPGTYTEDLTISTQVYIVADARRTATLVGSITLAVDGVEVYGMILAPTGTNNPIGNTAYYYSLFDCWVDCDAWEVGDDSTYTELCDFTMTADSGWSISGDGAIWHDENSMFGIDIPMGSSHKGGVVADSGAKLVLWNTDAYSNSAAAGTPLFYANANNVALNKIFLNNCRMINDDGPVIFVGDTGVVSIRYSYLESGHATSPAVQLQDSTALRSDYSIFKSITFDVAIRFQTRADAELRFPVLFGSLWADSTNVTSETEGIIDLVGPANITVTAKEIIADTNNTAMAYAFGIGRQLGSFRPFADGDGKIGTEAAAFDSGFFNNINVDTLDVDELLVNNRLLLLNTFIHKTGTGVASASTLTLGAGNVFVISGTADIDSIDTASPQASGSIIYLLFSGTAGTNGITLGNNITLPDTFAYTPTDVLTLLRVSNEFYQSSVSDN